MRILYPFLIYKEAAQSFNGMGCGNVNVDVEVSRVR